MSNQLTISALKKMYQAKEKIAALTAYDASFSALVSDCGIDIILVGDSLGMTIQGGHSTIPVTIEDMIYHTKCVSRPTLRAFLISDMPFMAYDNLENCLTNSAKLMRAGAQMVKVEGGEWLAENIQKLTERGIPVCGHLGLTPQSVHHLSGYKIQGREEQKASQIMNDALCLQQAGVDILVLECIPRSLAHQISEKLSIPTIGIGAGLDCSGQILVLHDMLGITSGRKLTFMKNYMTDDTHTIQQAIKNYVSEVKQGLFPTHEHSFD